MGMTDKKINKVLDLYEARLKQIATAGPDAVSDAGINANDMKHVRDMIPKMRKFLEQGRREKTFRWLGFMQGVFFSNGIYTVEAMANHNRPSKQELKEANTHHPFGQADHCEICKEYAEAPDDVTPA